MTTCQTETGLWDNPPQFPLMDGRLCPGPCGKCKILFHEAIATGEKQQMSREKIRCGIAGLGDFSAVRIFGTEGNLVIREAPERRILKRTLGKPAFQEIDKADLTAENPEMHAQEESLRDFARAVQERHQPAISGRHGLNALLCFWKQLRKRMKFNEILG